MNALPGTTLTDLAFEIAEDCLANDIAPDDYSLDALPGDVAAVADVLGRPATAEELAAFQATVRKAIDDNTADGALPEEIADLFTLSKGADGAWTIDWA